MSSYFKRISGTKQSAVIIISIFLISFLLQTLVEDNSVRWWSSFVFYVSLFGLVVSIIASLVNSIYRLIIHSAELKKYLLWIFISAIPILYFLGSIFRLMLFGFNRY